MITPIPAVLLKLYPVEWTALCIHLYEVADSAQQLGAAAPLSTLVLEKWYWRAARRLYANARAKKLRAMRLDVLTAKALYDDLGVQQAPLLVVIRGYLHQQLINFSTQNLE